MELGKILPDLDAKIRMTLLDICINEPANRMSAPAAMPNYKSFPSWRSIIAYIRQGNILIPPKVADVALEQVAGVGAA